MMARCERKNKKYCLSNASRRNCDSSMPLEIKGTFAYSSEPFMRIANTDFSNSHECEWKWFECGELSRCNLCAIAFGMAEKCIFGNYFWCQQRTEREREETQMNCQKKRTNAGFRVDTNFLYALLYTSCGHCSRRASRWKKINIILIKYAAYC